jgi:RNA polymerase sigma-70 factor (ECF subfamily)
MRMLTTPEREECFARLYRRYQPQLLAYARRRLPEADAVEVVADAFLNVWRHLDSAPTDPLPWLYRIAGNSAANHWRRDSRWQRLQDRAKAQFQQQTGPDPAVAAVGREQLATALAALADKDREVLRLAAWEGLDGAELAAALGCSAGAAKVRLHRARQRLARLLANTETPDHRASTTRSEIATEASP